jgi:hypothetical protein
MIVPAGEIVADPPRKIFQNAREHHYLDVRNRRENQNEMKV